MLRFDAKPFIHEVHHYNRLRIFAQLLGRQRNQDLSTGTTNQQGRQALKRLKSTNCSKRHLCSEFRIIAKFGLNSTTVVSIKKSRFEVFMAPMGEKYNLSVRMSWLFQVKNRPASVGKSLPLPSPGSRSGESSITGSSIVVIPIRREKEREREKEKM